MNIIKQKFKKGAASFYIVAFSTLILLIVATSFAAVIIAEVTRTSNEDLSQSAYDSALAGVEDAKLAYYNYLNCVADGADAGNASNSDGQGVTCSDIVNYVENASTDANDLTYDCDMVGHILGRIGENESGEVVVLESDVGNNMQQAYTCVKIDTILKDYRANVSSTEQTKAIKVQFASPTGENIADLIKKIRISWYDDKDTAYKYTNFGSNKVTFPTSIVANLAAPPTIAVSVLQTAGEFTLSDFDVAQGDRTDRGTVYLVPTKGYKNGDNQINPTYVASTWDGTTNNISKEGLLKSNDKTETNLPYAVNCSEEDIPDGSDFLCSATIELPRPVASIGSDVRNEDTFMVVVSLPYGKPSTNFALEFLCGSDDQVCDVENYKDEDAGSETSTGENVAYLEKMQVKIDSTGRANDLYRRVEARLESENNSSYITLGGSLELLGIDSGTGSGGGGSASGSAAKYVLDKDYTVKCEYDFDPTCTR